MKVTALNKDARFKVALDQVEVADFTQVRGLTATKEVLEYREGGINERFHKLMGGTRFAPIELSFGTSSSLELYDWVMKALSGTIERKNGSIMAINQDGTVVARWEFREAWPMRYDGPTFEHPVSEVAIARLVLAHNGFFLQKETDSESRVHGGLKEGDDEGVSKGQDEGGSGGQRTQQVRQDCERDGVQVWDDDEAGEFLDAHALSQGKEPGQVQAASVGNVMIIRPQDKDDPGLMRQEQCHIQQGQSSGDERLPEDEQQARDEAKKEDQTTEEQEQTQDEQARASSDPGYHP